MAFASRNVSASRPEIPPQVPASNRETTVARAKPLLMKVYCTLCTRTVEAAVGLISTLTGKRRLAVQPSQKCPNCGASLDAAFVLGNLS